MVLFLLSAENQTHEDASFRWDWPSVVFGLTFLPGTEMELREFTAWLLHFFANSELLCVRKQRLGWEDLTTDRKELGFVL